jgi:hypothetical protein
MPAAINPEFQQSRFSRDIPKHGDNTVKSKEQIL